MNRSFYNSGAPFLLNGGEPVGPGMDCLQLRQPSGPFHYLISEQAKSLVALQELQNEVGALLEFRDLVMETFPNLRTKLASSTPTTMTSHHTNSPSSTVSIRPGDWTPGVRVRKKLTNKDETRSGKKSGDIAIQDSGFSTETSSKETHSASSSTTAQPVSTAITSSTDEEVDDELWNLLDLIHRKGTRLKDEVEALQGSIREQDPNFQRVLFHASADDVRQLRQERDLLLDRLAEMEAEVIAGRVHTTRLQEDLESLLTAKQDLEEQLKAVVSQRGEVNSRIHDLHSQFVTRSVSSGDIICDEKTIINKDIVTSSQRTSKLSGSCLLDAVLDDKVYKVKVPDSRKIAAILKEHDVLVLKKHLLKSTVQNQVLQEKLDTAVGLQVSLRNKLEKAREENEELRFQLEDKNIELEGTRARVRVMENLQKPTSSPDIIPALDSSPSQQPSRSEISTASMKAMSPLPLNLQMDHTSSTESAHDQNESNRRGDVKRRPSKIPLKSYTAPKPPTSSTSINNGGKHSPAPRSRSGDRPPSAQSWRNNQSNSLNNGTNKTPIQKSRNSSLVSARDSLSSKLRSSDSLSKLSSSSFGGNNNNNGSNNGGSNTLKKQTNGKWGTSNTRDTTTTEKTNSSTRRKSPFPWNHSSFNSNFEQNYPDSLNLTTDNSTSQHFETANTFLWNNQTEFYDSIDSNMTSSLYQPNGEELAECDSLERHISDVSDKK